MNHPIYERLSTLCKEKGTSITALCEKVKGSKGNLVTWKKGKIDAVDLAMIKELLNISIDDILVDKSTCPVRKDDSTELTLEDIERMLAINNGVDWLEKLYSELREQRQKAYVLLWLVQYLASEGLPIRQILGK